MPHTHEALSSVINNLYYFDLTKWLLKDCFYIEYIQSVDNNHLSLDAFQINFVDFCVEKTAVIQQKSENSFLFFILVVTYIGMQKYARSSILCTKYHKKWY